MMRRLILLVLLFAPLWVWADDTKKSLTDARAGYQQAVNQYGRNSAQAKTARQNLRSARNAFHAERRRNASPSDDGIRRK